MIPASRRHFHCAHLAAVLLAASGLLSGCSDAGKQAESEAGNAGENFSEVERAVIDRSQERWGHLLGGDIESVYQYTSPAFRSLTSLQRFRAQLGDAVLWTDAEVQSAQCDDGRCLVSVEVTYRLRRERITHTRALNETWIRSGNEWWIHTGRS